MHTSNKKTEFLRDDQAVIMGTDAERGGKEGGRGINKQADDRKKRQQISAEGWG